MDQATNVQNLYDAVCASHSTNIYGKVRNPTFLLSLHNWLIMGQNGLFNLAMSTGLEIKKNKNSTFKPAVLHFKTDLVLNPAHDRGVE